MADVSESEPFPHDFALSCGFPICEMNRAGVPLQSVIVTGEETVRKEKMLI